MEIVPGMDLEAAMETAMEVEMEGEEVVAEEEEAVLEGLEELEVLVV